MNKFLAIGRLTADPEIRYTAGTEPMCVATYTLAVDREFKREGQPTADFIRCKALGKNGEFAGKYLNKGQKIAIEGKIRTGSYEKDGVKHYTTEVYVERHEFCEGKKTESTPSYSAPASDIPEGFQTVSDDDIPF